MFLRSTTPSTVAIASEGVAGADSNSKVLKRRRCSGNRLPFQIKSVNVSNKFSVFHEQVRDMHNLLSANIIPKKSCGDLGRQQFELLKKKLSAPACPTVEGVVERRNNSKNGLVARNTDAVLVQVNG